MIEEEGFVSYIAQPLISKGEVKGVLVIFQRRALTPDDEWLDFLEALAEQAAIALDNAALFENLQRANLELTLAYDATIEGWSRALDLRDQETEGHSQRVTTLAVRLAQVVGTSGDELLHIRRGALLHDIGKMGIPDSILLKPGPLTEEEWQIMRRHPTYAYELLLPIRYLRLALDIPYCHHEKWDGTGYPRGLQGEKIPLAARIFAVVDVYDALSSNRPYRPAWPPERVTAYLREQAGHHFDPAIVQAFLTLDRA
jgi:putative nucleotidyltransferase with HDIG domain